MSIQQHRDFFLNDILNPNKGICIILGEGLATPSKWKTLGKLFYQAANELGVNELNDLSHKTKEALSIEKCLLKVVHIESKKKRSELIGVFSSKIKNLEYSDGYRILCCLAEEGVVDAIVSMGMDDNLESSFSDLNLNSFQVFGPGIALPHLIKGRKVRTKKVPLVKLNGEISSCKKNREIETLMAFKNKKRTIRTIHWLSERCNFVFIEPNLSNLEYFEKCAVVKSTDKSQNGAWIVMGNSGYSFQSQNRDVVWMKTTFNQFFCKDCVAYLARRTYFKTSESFVKSLVDERIRIKNSDFISSLNIEREEFIKNLYIPREKMHNILFEFILQREKNFFVILGNSGTGKSSTIGWLLAQKYIDNLSVISLKAKTFSSSNFAETIALFLGHLSTTPLATVYQFSDWSRRKNLRFCFVIDGINEYSKSVDSAIELVREIMNIARTIQVHRSISFLITSTPDTWNKICDSIDSAEYERIFWRIGGHERGTAMMHQLNDCELDVAIKKYASYFSIPKLLNISKEERSICKDPMLLSWVSRSFKSLGTVEAKGSLLNRTVVDVIEEKLPVSEKEKARYTLFKLAKICAEKGNSFSFPDFMDCGGNEELLVHCVEKNIIQPFSGRYQITHERLTTCLLSIGMHRYGFFSITNSSTLVEAFFKAMNDTIYISAMKIYLMNFCKTSSSLEMLLKILDTYIVVNGIKKREEMYLYDFCIECLFEHCAKSSLRVHEVCIENIRNKNINCTPLGRALLGCTKHLEVEIALSVLSVFIKNADHKMMVEVLLFIDDIVYKTVCTESVSNSSRLLVKFLDESYETPLNQLMHLLRFLSHLAEDNLTSKEFDSFKEVFRVCSNEITRNVSITSKQVHDFCHSIPKYSNTYLFNSSSDTFEAYCRSVNQKDLKSVALNVLSGKPLTIDDIYDIQPYIQELEHPFEFIACNLILIVSMELNPVHSINLFGEYFESFNKGTPPEEIDFFTSSLFLSTYINDMDTQAVLGQYIEKILISLPQAIISNPGQYRSSRRGVFLDPFDQQFEDGFNPITSFTYLAPSDARKNLSFSKFKSLNHEGMNTQLALLWKHLEHYLRTYNNVATIRVIHALGQMIGIWPEPGLGEITRLINTQDPVVLRGLKRVLSEAFYRYPNNTRIALEAAESHISKDDWISFKHQINPRLYQLAFEQIHWARILRFVSEHISPGFNKFLLKQLVTQETFPDFISSLIHALSANAP